MAKIKNEVIPVFYFHQKQAIRDEAMAREKNWSDSFSEDPAISRFSEARVDLNTSAQSGNSVVN